MTHSLFHVPRDEFDRVRAIEDRATRVAVFASACRINALYAIAKAGSGHVGSSFSALDLLSWLYLEELRTDGDEPWDLYFSSKGHDVPAQYAVLAALGRIDFDRLHALRRIDGLPGHPDVSVPHIAANTGSLGMGISKAKGMIDAHRRRGEERCVYVMLGDGELQEGQIWESLGTAVRERMGALTVIVDANGLQSDTFVDRTSFVGDVAARFVACGWQVATCNGHDLGAIEATLASFAETTDRPHVLIAETIKGRGVSFMEPTAIGDDGLYAYHSGAPSPDDYAAAVAELVATANDRLAAVGDEPLRLIASDRDPAPAAPRGVQRLIPTYERALVAAAAERDDVMVLDADLYRDCGLAAVREQFPERFVECGIAEQDMVSRAGGMALAGLRPVVHSFACFLAARPNEHVYNNATEGTRIVYVGSLAGQLPGGPGHSHQATRDIAALSGVPGLTMLEPCCEAEIAPLLAYALDDAPGSTYLRLVSIPVDVPYDWPAAPVRRGCGTTLRGGSDGVFIGHGPVALSEAYRAASRLAADDGLEFAVVALPWLNVIDRTWLDGVTDGIPLVVTVEDHQLDGGQGQRLAATLAECSGTARPRLLRLGVEGVPRCGRNDEVLRAHGLDARSIANRVRSFVAAGAKRGRVRVKTPGVSENTGCLSLPSWTLASDPAHSAPQGDGGPS